MRVDRLAAVSVLLILGAAPAVVAQGDGAPKGLEVVKNPTRRSGFWGSVGFGVGSETFSVPDSVVQPGWLAAPTFNLRVGGTPDIHLRLGGELISWYNNNGGYSQSLGGMLGDRADLPLHHAGILPQGRWWLRLEFVRDRLLLLLVLLLPVRILLRFGLHVVGRCRLGNSDQPKAEHHADRGLLRVLFWGPIHGQLHRADVELRGVGRDSLSDCNRVFHRGCRGTAIAGAAAPCCFSASGCGD